MSFRPEYTDERLLNLSGSFLSPILDQLRSSNRVKLPLNLELVNDGAIKLKARYYYRWLNKTRTICEYHLIISNDERRRILRAENIII